MGVAALILGIISLLISFGFGAAGIGWIGSICGILAIVLGAIGRKNPEQKGVATGGLVCGVIALFFGIIATIACVACINATGSAFNDLLR